MPGELAEDRHNYQASLMSDEQTPHHFSAIRRLMATLRPDDSAPWKEMDAALEDLQITHEQMQTCLETTEAVEAELLQQKQHYQNLFQFSPIPSLLTDAYGVILEANRAIAKLLNVPSIFLIGKTLASFVVERDRRTFRTHLNQLSRCIGIQICQISLCPRGGEAVTVELHVGIVCNTNGLIESLRIGVCNVRESQQVVP